MTFSFLVPAWVVTLLAAIVITAYPLVDTTPWPLRLVRISPYAATMLLYAIIEQSDNLAIETTRVLGRWLIVWILVAQLIYLLWYLLRKEQITYAKIVDAALEREVGHLENANTLLGRKLAEYSGTIEQLKAQVTALQNELETKQ